MWFLWYIDVMYSRTSAHISPSDKWSGEGAVKKLLEQCLSASTKSTANGFYNCILAQLLPRICCTNKTERRRKG